MDCSERHIFLANYQFLWKAKRCVFSYSHNVRISPKLGEEKELLCTQRSKG